MSAEHLSDTDLKACCAAGYSTDLVGLLLGRSYHPGGLALTRQLAGHLGVRAEDRVVDVAAGLGTTAFMLASEYNARVDGVDLSTSNVRSAEDAAVPAGVVGRVRFHVGDAERLPLEDASADIVLCECALCTFPDKPTAAAEFARILRPGGRVGISDVVAERDRLPAALTSLSAWIACVADARTVDDYSQILTQAGLTITLVESHSDALSRMIDQIEARLTLLRMAAPGRLDDLGVDLGAAPGTLAAARDAVARGTLGYALLIATKPL